MKTFKLWLENKDSRIEGNKSVILNFLQDRLNIDKGDVILQMSTKDIDQDVISDLLGRGIVKTINKDIINSIKNGITIQELIDLLASDETGSGSPTPNQEPPPFTSPALQPPQNSNN